MIVKHGIGDRMNSGGTRYTWSPLEPSQHHASRQSTLRSSGSTAPSTHTGLPSDLYNAYSCNERLNDCERLATIASLPSTTQTTLTRCNRRTALAKTIKFTPGRVRRRKSPASATDSRRAASRRRLAAGVAARAISEPSVAGGGNRADHPNDPPPVEARPLATSAQLDPQSQLPAVRPLSAPRPLAIRGAERSVLTCGRYRAAGGRSGCVVARG